MPMLFLDATDHSFKVPSEFPVTKDRPFDSTSYARTVEDNSDIVILGSISYEPVSLLRR